VEDAAQADERGEDAGEQATRERAEVVGEAVVGNGEPAEGLWQEQEGTGVLGGREVKDRWREGHGLAWGRRLGWRGRHEDGRRVGAIGVRRGILRVRRRRGRGVACGAVEAIGVEEGMQGLKGDGDAEGACEEVEGVVVSRVGVVSEELGDRPGVTWQQLTVGAAGQASVTGLDNLLGGKPLVP